MNMLEKYGHLPLHAALPGKGELLLDARYEIERRANSLGSASQIADKEAALKALGFDEKELEILRFVAKQNEKDFKKHNRSFMRKFAGSTGKIAAGVIGGTAAFAIGLCLKAGYGFVRRYPRFSFLTAGVLSAGASTTLSKEAFVESVVDTYEGVKNMDDGTKKTIADTAISTGISYIAQIKHSITSAFEAIDEINERTHANTDVSDIKRAVKPVRSAAIEAGKNEIPASPATARPSVSPQAPSSPQADPNTGRKVFPVSGPITEIVIAPDGSEHEVPLIPQRENERNSNRVQDNQTEQQRRSVRAPAQVVQQTKPRPLPQAPQTPQLRPRDAMARAAARAPRPRAGTISTWEKISCSVYYFQPKEAAACTAEALLD